MSDQDSIRATIKRLIVESLHIQGLAAESIGDEQRLFGEGLGLDSVDALELVVALEKEFGISIQSHELDRAVFANVTSLADLVVKCRSEAATPPHA